MSLAAAVGISLVMTLLVLGICAYLIVRLPFDYFVRPNLIALDHPGRVRRVFDRVLRNVIGLALLVLGLVLVIPGVPGPGVLALFAGLLLADVPGKRRLLRVLLARAPVRMAVNRLRRWFKALPLALPDGA